MARFDGKLAGMNNLGRPEKPVRLDGSSGWFCPSIFRVAVGMG
jgi:hypothetical protein